MKIEQYNDNVYVSAKCHFYFFITREGYQTMTNSEDIFTGSDLNNPSTLIQFTYTTP